MACVLCASCFSSGRSDPEGFADGTKTMSSDTGDVLVVRGDYTVRDDGVKADASVGEGLGSTIRIGSLTGCDNSARFGKRPLRWLRGRAPPHKGWRTTRTCRIRSRTEGWPG